MYTTASGVQIPQGTDSFSPATQFKNWADKAATYENRVIVATDSERNNLVAPVRRDGLECYVTGTDKTWIYDGTGWVLSGGDQLLVSQTFTGASSVPVTGIVGFESYEIEIQVTGTSVANLVSLRLRNGVSDDSSANYDSQRVSAAGAAVAAAEVNAATAWADLPVSPRTAYMIKGTVYGLSSARQTFADLTVFAALPTSSLLMVNWGLRHRSTTAFNGLTLIVAAGTITGTIKVTGKRS